MDKESSSITEDEQMNRQVTNNLPYCALSTGYKEKYVEQTANTKFLGLRIDYHLNLKNFIDHM